MDIYEKAWAGKHGQEYTKRCDVDPESRKAIFKSIFDYMPKPNWSVLEVGCNKGHNLDAIYARSFSNKVGIDINKDVCSKPYIINGSIYSLPWADNVFDVVFTSGVLIHIPKERLKEAIAEMNRVSSRFVLMIEYPSDKEEGTIYGEDFNNQEGVWSRPYGEIYQKQFPKDKEIKHGKISDLGDDGWGFTKCDYWIFEKHS